MTEAAKVARFSQDRERIDRPDLRDHAQELVVTVLGQCRVRDRLDLVALADQAARLGYDHAEHHDRRRVQRHGQRSRRGRSGVDVIDQARLRHLATDQRPSLGREAVGAECGYAGGVGKRSSNARNPSDRLFPAKLAISGKYSGR